MTSSSSRFKRIDPLIGSSIDYEVDTPVLGWFYP
jgi:hypothetical protein